MTLTREELLIILVEECGEVIQAATKCLRFGWDHDEPGYGLNSQVLAAEIGDLLGIVDTLGLDQWHIARNRKNKLLRALRAKSERTFPSNGD